MHNDYQDIEMKDHTVNMDEEQKMIEKEVKRHLEEAERNKLYNA